MHNLESEIDPLSSFNQFELDARLLDAVAKLGFTVPTPIQKRAIPALLSGRDVIGRARTGSGKTAAFGLPLVQAITASPATGLSAMVVTPTRELALQVTEALRTYAAGTGVEFVTVYGGAAYEPQFRALRAGVQVVVGTPGRLIDHLERGSLDLSTLKMLVLDEADEMLRMGFIEDINRLLEATPDSRQVALFSATMPRPIRVVAEAYLKNPIEVQGDASSHPVDHIEQAAMLVPHRFKMDALTRVLQAKSPGATLVFAQTRTGCAEIAETLANRGFAVEALHGDLSQYLRERVLGRFRSKQVEIVVATDIAARGIDVEHITHVINLDLPHDTESYIHRIGRTGRAGRKGQAISFVTPAERRRVQLLERTLQTTIERISVPTDAEIAGMHRTALHSDLKAALEEKVDHLGELADFLAAGAWTVDDLALAAVRLLASNRGVKLDDAPSQLPPEWARSEAPQREPRAAREMRGAKDARGHGASHDHDARPADEVELVLLTGREHGTRPGDLVGALTAETGVPGRILGRISITDHASFVGCSRDTAERILASNASVKIRGKVVAMSLARASKPAVDHRDVPSPIGARPASAIRAKREKPAPRKSQKQAPQAALPRHKPKQPEPAALKPERQTSRTVPPTAATRAVPAPNKPERQATRTPSSGNPKRSEQAPGKLEMQAGPAAPSSTADRATSTPHKEALQASSAAPPRQPKLNGKRKLKPRSGKAGFGPLKRSKKRNKGNAAPPWAVARTVPGGGA